VDTAERRLSEAADALKTLFALCDLEQPSDVERDAAIKRFEYTFEAVWKAAQAVLGREGLAANSPRAAIRECRTIGVLDDPQTEAAITMIADRNLTTHTYRRARAEEVFRRLGGYARLLQAWLAALERRYARL
jgi:nucleotidyltransferase substrate binding protein (TIGR01987 family)